jgi:hypothetical protein
VERLKEKNFQIALTPVDDSQRYSYSSCFLIAFRSDGGRFVDDGVMLGWCDVGRCGY